MLKAEQIPDEVIVAACEEYGGGHLVDMKHAIAAAINAWPGMDHDQGALVTDIYRDPGKIILPLPKEASDE